MSHEAMRQLYTRLAGAIAPHVDLFLIETMSCLSHANAAVSAAAAFGAHQTCYDGARTPLYLGAHADPGHSERYVPCPVDIVHCVALNAWHYLWQCIGGMTHH